MVSHCHCYWVSNGHLTKHTRNPQHNSKVFGCGIRLKKHNKKANLFVSLSKTVEKGKTEMLCVAKICYNEVHICVWVHGTFFKWTATACRPTKWFVYFSRMRYSFSKIAIIQYFSVFAISMGVAIWCLIFILRLYLFIHQGCFLLCLVA